MPERDAGTSHDGEQLCELSHLSAAISHHVINAFSAIVSSAELIRSHTVSASDHSELDALATAIVESALDASQVSRRLIDWSRRGTTVGRGQAGSEMPDVDINQLIRERVESEKAVATGQADWVLSLGSIPSIPGNATALGPMLSCLLRNARERAAEGRGSRGGVDFHRPSRLGGHRDSRLGLRYDHGGPQARDRAFFQHQARPLRCRAHHRPGNLAPAWRHTGDREPARSGNHHSAFGRAASGRSARRSVAGGTVIQERDQAA